MAQPKHEAEATLIFIGIVEANDSRKQPLSRLLRVVSQGVVDDLRGLAQRVLQIGATHFDQHPAIPCTNQRLPTPIIKHS